MFCTLKKEIKDFEIFKRYLKCLQEHGRLFTISNQIQADEMREYCRHKNVSEKDQKTLIEWVDLYAKEFRDYLNTIQLVCIVFIGNGRLLEFMTIEDFFEIEDRLNKLNLNDTFVNVFEFVDFIQKGDI